MREKGTMWQIGVLTRKLCTFSVQNGSFLSFFGITKKGQTFEGFGRKMAHSLRPESGFLLTFIAETRFPSGYG